MNKRGYIVIWSKNCELTTARRAGPDADHSPSREDELGPTGMRLQIKFLHVISTLTLKILLIPGNIL